MKEMDSTTQVMTTTRNRKVERVFCSFLLVGILESMIMIRYRCERVAYSIPVNINKV